SALRLIEVHPRSSILMLFAALGITACGRPGSASAGPMMIGSNVPTEDALGTVPDGDGPPPESTPTAPALAFPMPDSPAYCVDGQVHRASCPARGDRAYGQDGNYVVNAASYDVRTDVVHDRVTGLDWERQPSDALDTWTAARNRCERLALDGHPGWRLP